MCCNGDIFLALLAVLFPPIAVWIKQGICSADSLLNILLCMLGYIPGLLHAWYIIAKYPEGVSCEHEEVRYHTIPADGGESGGNTRVERVTYYYVRNSSGGRNNVRQQQPGRQQGGMSYGTVNHSQAQAPAAQGPPQGGSNQEGVPPSYQEAVQGDQTP